MPGKPLLTSLLPPPTAKPMGPRSSHHQPPPPRPRAAHAQPAGLGPSALTAAPSSASPRAAASSGDRDILRQAGVDPFCRDPNSWPPPTGINRRSPPRGIGLLRDHQHIEQELDAIFGQQQPRQVPGDRSCTSPRYGPAPWSARRRDQSAPRPSRPRRTPADRTASGQTPSWRFCIGVRHKFAVLTSGIIIRAPRPGAVRAGR